MPISILKNISKFSDICIWEITENTSALEDILNINILEKEELKLLLNDKKKNHWLAARISLKKLLKTNSFIQIEKTPDGKPFLKDHNWHFSLSHSKDFAAAILNKQSNVGIDIEFIDSGERIKKVSSKFLTQKELNVVPSDETATTFLYTCWSAKETIFKYIGKKGVSLKDDIYLHPFSLSDGYLIGSYADIELKISFIFNKGYVITYTN